MSEFLIAYDIKNQKRVAKFGRFMSKNCIRIEYSVFYTKMSKEKMSEFAIKILDYIDTNEDDVRIYEIIDYGIALGKADLLDEIYIIR
jgi:CRISPR-associated protein Cas2